MYTERLILKCSKILPVIAFSLHSYTLLCHSGRALSFFLPSVERIRKTVMQDFFKFATLPILNSRLSVTRPRAAAHDFCPARGQSYFLFALRHNINLALGTRQKNRQPRAFGPRVPFLPRAPGKISILLYCTVRSCKCV